MNIRRAIPDDIDSIAHLYSTCFTDPHKTISKWREELTPNARRKIENIFVAEIGASIVGALTLLDHTVGIGGRIMKSGGIGGVAVAPEYRRQGIARTLMSAAFAAMRKTQTSLSMLYPFNHSYYQSLGYGLVGEVRIYSVTPAALPASPESKNVRRFRSSDLPALVQCYNEYALRNTLMIMRGEHIWRYEISRRSKSGEQIFCYEEHGALTGYLVFNAAVDIEMKEFVAASRSALRALLGFLHDQSKEVRSIRIPAAASDALQFLLTNPTDASKQSLFGLFPLGAKIGYGYMMRVIDVQSALVQRKFLPSHSEISFRIADGQIAENNKVFTIALDGDTHTVSTKPAATIIDIPVSTFAQLYCGYLSFTTAQQLGILAPQPDLSFLDCVFAVPPPHCLDFF